MKNKKLTALILCFTMLFSITSGIFSAAFASDGTTDSAYSLDTTTGSAYKVDKGPMLFSTKANAVELAEEEVTPAPDYSAYAAHKGMHAIFSEDGYFEAVPYKPTTFKDGGEAIMYSTGDFSEDILFEVRDYTVVHDYYDITDKDTGAVTGVTTVSSLWYQLDIISGEATGTEEGGTLFQDGFWVFQNFLAGTEPYEYDTLTLLAPETGKTVQFKTDIFPSLYASIGGTGFSTMKEVPSAMVIIEKYTDENGEVWYYVDAVEGETWPTDCAGYHYVKANMVEVVEQEDEEDETPALETTTDNKTFAIYDENGALPAGAILDVEAIDEETTTYIEETAFGISKLPEGFAGLAYDISILDENNEKVQPDGSVVVRISGIDTENKFFAVAHFPGMSYKNIVGNTILNYEELEVTTIGDGYIEFVTDGFSIYYIVSGTQTENYQGNDTFYILQGTTIDIEATLKTITFPDNVTKTATGVLGFAVYNDAKEYAQDDFGLDLEYTSILGRSTVFRTTSETKIGTYILKSVFDDWSDDLGGTFTIHVVTPDEMFEILDELDGTDGADPPKAYFKILNDSTTIPAEPSVITEDEAGSEGKYTYVTYADGSNVFSKTITPENGVVANQLLDLEGIAASGALKQNAQGNNIIGIVDTSGQGDYTLPHTTLSKANWHQLLKDYVAYCAKNGIQVQISGNTAFQDISDGDTDKALEEIYGSEYRYQMYPYVIKLVGKTDGQDGDLLGWHVDCAIIDKKKYSLSYDFNLPSTVEFTDGVAVTIPGTAYYGASDAAPTVGAITVRGTAIAKDGKVSIKDNESLDTVTYTFTGWNTSPDGTGTSYDPGHTIAVTENTTLYAIWKVPNTMRLINTELFEDENDWRKASSRNYTFRVTVAGGDVTANRDYGYTVYNTENTSFVRKGSIKSGETITMTGGQTAWITNVPTGATVTAATEPVGGGADSVSYKVAGSVVSDTNSPALTLTGAETDTIEFIHQFDAQLGDLTITTTGCNAIDTNQSFIFNVKGNNSGINDNIDINVVVHENRSVIIKNLPIGTYIVQEKTDWAWRYELANIAQTINLTEEGPNTVIFAHDRKVTTWLDGNAWRDFFNGSSTGSPAPVTLSLAFVDMVWREEDKEDDVLVVQLA